jgi:uncharacterized protein (DUF488 family)
VTASHGINLYTIGYEGRTQSGLVSELRRNGVMRVVDVRELPLSRKPGFSKSALADALTAHGIGYDHRRELGTPEPVRAAYKRTHDFDRLTKQYLAYIGRNGAAVDGLLETAAAETCCLLCFERDPRQCHRSLLADALVRRGGDRVVLRHL